MYYNEYTNECTSDELKNVRLSKHVDQQKFRIAELEREIYWLNREARGLEEQMNKVDTEIQQFRISREANAGNRDTLRELSLALVSISTSLMYSSEEHSDRIISDTFSSLEYLDERFSRFVPKLPSSSLCASVIDAPPSHIPIEEFFQAYLRGICDILRRPIGSVLPVSVKRPDSKTFDWSLYYTLRSSDVNTLKERISRYSLQPPRDSSTDALQVLNTTQTVMINLPPLVEEGFPNTGTSVNERRASIPGNLSQLQGTWGIKSPRIHYKPHVSSWIYFSINIVIWM